MKHFFADDKGALEDFEKALGTKYSEQSATKEEITSAEKGLNERLKEYVELVKSADKKPRLFEMKDAADGH